MTGLGFGIMAGVFSLVNVLADSAGPGTLGFRGESQYFFLVSALLCQVQILCHVCWGVAAFAAMDAADKARRFGGLAFVWGSHFALSLLVRL